MRKHIGMVWLGRTCLESKNRVREPGSKSNWRVARKTQEPSKQGLIEELGFFQLKVKCLSGLFQLQRTLTLCIWGRDRPKRPEPVFWEPRPSIWAEGPKAAPAARPCPSSWALPPLPLPAWPRGFFPSNDTRLRPWPPERPAPSSSWPRASLKQTRAAGAGLTRPRARPRAEPSAEHLPLPSRVTTTSAQPTLRKWGSRRGWALRRRLASHFRNQGLGGGPLTCVPDYDILEEISVGHVLAVPGASFASSSRAARSSLTRRCYPRPLGVRARAAEGSKPLATLSRSFFFLNRRLPSPAASLSSPSRARLLAPPLLFFPSASSWALKGFLRRARWRRLAGAGTITGARLPSVAATSRSRLRRRPGSAEVAGAFPWHEGEGRIPAVIQGAALGAGAAQPLVRGSRPGAVTLRKRKRRAVPQLFCGFPRGLPRLSLLKCKEGHSRPT